jgi:polysaccharide biosynthesis transport protein
MEETRFDPLDYVSVLRRRKWWLIVPMALAVTVGLALVLFLPKEYLSQATIGVTAPAVSSDFVRSAAPLDAEERLRAISQQLLSKALLERVVQEELHGKGRSAEAAVWDLRRRVEVSLPETLPTQSGRPALDAFVVSYMGRTPSQAQRVTQRLADVFAEENTRTRRARAEGTAQFIANQAEASRHRLELLEQELRKAKESHMGRLPEQTQANLQMASGLRQQLESTTMALRSEQDRLSMLERQLNGFRGGDDDLLLPSESARNIHTHVLVLQRQLAEARANYTDKHPEVVRLREELARAREAAAIDRDQPDSERLAGLQADPAYRQLVSDRETTRLRIQELRRAETQIRRQIAQYDSRIETAPMVEQQLAALQRQYDLERQQHDSLTEKHRAALLAEDLEEKRGGEQFTVLYAASFPTTPAKPNRARVFLVALFLGVAVGGGLVTIREYVDRSIYDARTLERDFDLPVLGEIGRIDRAA